MNRVVKSLCLAVQARRWEEADALARRLTAPRRSSKPRSKRPARVEKGERRSDATAHTAGVCAAVFERAKGRCEAHVSIGVSFIGPGPGRTTLLRCLGNAEILDHWLGGVGRRRQRETVETCWALCRRCNEHRTANHPDAGFWNRSFEEHCRAHGYSFTPHITRASRASGAGGGR